MSKSKEEYQKLDQSTADKYGTTARIVALLRNCYYSGKCLVPLEAANKIRLLAETHTRSKKYDFYMDGLIFAKRLTGDQYADICKKYE